MNLPPYGWVDSNGEKKGIIYEMTEEIGKRYGKPYSHRILPFNRMLKMLDEGNVDLLSSQPHKKAMAAGDKLGIQFLIDVIAPSKKDSNIQKLTDYKGKTMIYHQGASYPQLEGFPEKIVKVESYEQAVRMLHGRRGVHGAVFSEPAYYYFMAKAELTNEDFGKVIMVESAKEQWIFANRNMPQDTRDTLSEIIRDIYDSGMYERMLAKYGKSE